MAKYRKKPVVIEAALYISMACRLEDGFDRLVAGTVSDPAQSACLQSWYPKCPPAAQIMLPYIHGVTGREYICKGDYILTNPEGGRFLKKKEQFERDYELISVDFDS